MLLNIGRILIANHPMHLHGHHFRVVGWGKLGKTTTLGEFKRYEQEGRIPLKLNNPPRSINAHIYIVYCAKTVQLWVHFLNNNEIKSFKMIDAHSSKQKRFDFHFRCSFVQQSRFDIHFRCSFVQQERFGGRAERRLRHRPFRG